MDRPTDPNEPVPTDAPVPPAGGAQRAFEHRPVMLDEIVEVFRPVPAGVLVDATLGGAGHAVALLDALPQLRLLGLDRDPDAVAVARERLARFGDRARAVHGRLDDVDDEVIGAGLSGALFDLGVSSPQLDRAERGFSHRFDAPLDMRMDATSSDPTAADLVNTLPEDALADLLHTFGDERYARRIARAIVANRPVERTAQLADLVRDAIPAPARRRGGHPAKRSFQALRIAVNRELELLPVALHRAIALLGPGGRCAVLAYHSGEDRIVKQVFREASTGGCTCPPGLPCACGATPVVRLVRRVPRKPSAAEMAANPRAESARLRSVEKLEAA